MSFRLNGSHRSKIDYFNRKERWDSFYHYFPMLLATSESTTPMLLRTRVSHLEEPLISVISEGYYEYYYPPISEGRLIHSELRDKKLKGVFISLIRCPNAGWRNELYDTNFFYNLEVTLKIKNFRKNIAKFERFHKDAVYRVAYHNDLEGIISLMRRWYSKSNRKEFTDYGYTLWLIKNQHLFTDLHARVVEVNGRDIVAISLWGEFRAKQGLGIHIVCKDSGLAYLQDWTRYKTYEEMLKNGFSIVNDGGDAGVEGIRIYKLKLRPIFIIPIYSWVRA